MILLYTYFLKGSSLTSSALNEIKTVCGCDFCEVTFRTHCRMGSTELPIWSTPDCQLKSVAVFWAMAMMYSKLKSPSPQSSSKQVPLLSRLLGSITAWVDILLALKKDEMSLELNELVPRLKTCWTLPELPSARFVDMRKRWFNTAKVTGEVVVDWASLLDFGLWDICKWGKSIALKTWLMWDCNLVGSLINSARWIGGWWIALLFHM